MPDFDLSSKHRPEYISRVNRVVDYVREHVDEPLPIARLAHLAALSPFHFHRVFKSVSGEPLAAFVLRTRLEKAARALVANRRRSALYIALQHGFSSAATFARAFRAHFGMAPTDWRRGGHLRYSKNRKLQSKACKANVPLLRDAHGVLKVTITDIPAQRIAYMRRIAPYEQEGILSFWLRVWKWVIARGLATPELVSLGVIHDDVDVTHAGNCQYDAAVVVADDFEPDAGVNMGYSPGGRYAAYAYDGPIMQMGAVWREVFDEWFAMSGFRQDDRPCLVVFCGSPMPDGAAAGRLRGQLCVPVRLA